MAALTGSRQQDDKAVARTRTRLLTSLRQQGIRDEQVLAQIDQVPRHWFMDEALSSFAYDNTALPIGSQQTISQPYIVARMTELLMQGTPMQNVLEIGTGCGYQTAVLAPLVQRVYTIERIDALLVQARERFRRLGLKNIRTRHADGGLGWSEYSPFDGILVTAAPAGIPLKLVAQLRLGGRMVLPIGTEGEQALVLVLRTQNGHEKTLLEPVSFVSLRSGVV